MTTYHNCSAATVTLNTRAFAGAMEANRHQVDPADGSIRIYDDVAGHFTSCHTLSERDAGRVRSAARRVLRATGRA